MSREYLNLDAFPELVQAYLSDLSAHGIKNDIDGVVQTVKQEFWETYGLELSPKGVLRMKKDAVKIANLNCDSNFQVGLLRFE